MIGYPSTKVFYERAERFAGESKYPLKKMIAFAWDGITSMSGKPIEMIAQIGFFLILVSVVLAGYCVAQKIWGYTVPGWTSLCAVLCCFSAIQFLALSVVGQYVAKIYKECKARPLFIIQEFSGPEKEKPSALPPADQDRPSRPA